MQNETNLSAEKINSLLNLMKKQNNDPEKIKSFIASSLADSQKEKLNAILSDPKKLNEILSSPRARELMKKFGQSPQGENGNGSSGP